MKLTLKQACWFILGISAPICFVPIASSQTPQVGLEFEGFGLNQAQVTVTKFFGDCPGEEVKNIKAYFISSVNPPAQGRRVIVRNVTEGINSREAPHSNREYNSGRSSQGINLSPGTRHTDRSLVFIPNKINVFEFDIVQNNQIVEQGLFDADLKANTQNLQRNINWVSETFCITTGNTNINNCQNLGTRDKGSCPGEYSYRYRNVRAINNQNQVPNIIVIPQY